MYAFSADMSTIRQKETPKAESLQEQRLKISLKAGCARHAEWESNTSRKRNKDSKHPQNIAILRTEGQKFTRPTLLFTDIKKKQKHKKEKNISLRGWENIEIHDVCSELSGKIINIIDMEQTNIGEITTLSSEDGKKQIEERIFNIRGKQVMIDKDLALLYGVETKRLNEQVKRNIERFPEDFMFQLTQEECLRSQIATLNQAQGKHLKYLPFAFTENGIAMLSSVLRSETAIAVNIKIMRTFTKIRKSVPQDSNLLNRVELIEYNQSDMRKLFLETNIEHIILFASRIVPQKQAPFSVSMLPNGGSRSKTAIVTEKPADSSVTMT